MSQLRVLTLVQPRSSTVQHLMTVHLLHDGFQSLYLNKVLSSRPNTVTYIKVESILSAARVGAAMSFHFWYQDDKEAHNRLKRRYLDK